LVPVTAQAAVVVAGQITLELPAKMELQVKMVLLVFIGLEMLKEEL
jgi:hypothetical protein